MGVTFVSQQYMQNVLGYSPLKSGTIVIPAAIAMIIAAPISAKLIGRFGSRVTLLAGYASLALSLIICLTLWTTHASLPVLIVAISCMGLGVGLAGTPASHSLTGSVPVQKAGMASGTADLQRDLGGSIMQSLLGALLTAGYANAILARAAKSHTTIPPSIVSEAQRSFAGAEVIAKQYPAHAEDIIGAARDSFLHGSHWAYGSGLIFIVAGALLVIFAFPGKKREGELLASYGND
jgi:MFS family permease